MPRLCLRLWFYHQPFPLLPTHPLTYVPWTEFLGDWVSSRADPESWNSKADGSMDVNVIQIIGFSSTSVCVLEAMNITVNSTHFSFPLSVGVVKALQFYSFREYHFGTLNLFLVILRDRRKMS